MLAGVNRVKEQARPPAKGCGPDCEAVRREQHPDAIDAFGQVKGVEVVGDDRCVLDFYDWIVKKWAIRKTSAGRHPAHLQRRRGLLRRPRVTEGRAGEQALWRLRARQRIQLNVPVRPAG
jgi:hypothetical protein